MSGSYGGIFERGVKEYTLDDFYALQLDKLDRFMCLKASGIAIDDKTDDESSDDDNNEDEDEDEDDDEYGEDDDGDDYDDTVAGESPEEVQQLSRKSDDLENISKEVEVRGVMEGERVQSNLAFYGSFAYTKQDDLRTKVTAFMGVARDSTRSREDVISTPLPSETLTMFYARSRG